MDKLFAQNAQKTALAIIIISILGLLAIPLFPWFGWEQERVEWDWETDEETRIRVTDYQFGSYTYISILADTPGVPDEFEDMDGDISNIALCFWISLFLGIIAFGGVALYRTGRAQGLAHVMLLIGAAVIVFSILALIFHALFIYHLGEFESMMNEGNDNDEQDDKITFGYNYIPLIMSMILLIVSISYLTKITPHSRGALSRIMGARYGAVPMYPQYQQTQVYQQQPAASYQTPPQQPSTQPLPPTQVTCPSCNNVINVKATSYPAPVTCPVCGTRGFIE